MNQTVAGGTNRQGFSALFAHVQLIPVLDVPPGDGFPTLFAVMIRDIADDEGFETAKAMLRLIYERNAGIRSGKEEGWVSEADVRAQFQNKRKWNTP